MNINYQQHQQRISRAKDFWLKVIADYNAGMSAQTICERYINPNTGRHYSREHIYWVLKQAQRL